MRLFVELDIDETLLPELLARNRARLVATPPSKPEQPQSRSPEKRWLRVTEAAKYAAVSRSAMYEAIASGRLRHARPGGGSSIRLVPEWVDSWMESGQG